MYNFLSFHLNLKFKFSGEYTLVAPVSIRQSDYTQIHGHGLNIVFTAISVKNAALKGVVCGVGTVLAI